MKKIKKSLAILAITAAFSTPFSVLADTILYGSARVSLDYADEGDSSGGDGSWDVFNNGSRFGVYGAEDLGGGLSAIYQYEFGVDITEGGNFESDRPKFVGLKGDFGQITAGTHETPYYRMAGVVDLFNSDRSLGSTAFLGGSFSGLSLNTGEEWGSLADGSLIRLSNSLHYITPDFSGFSAEAMLVADGSVNDGEGRSNDVDLWNLAAKYSNDPFSVSVNYIQLNGDDGVLIDNDMTVDLDLDQWMVAVGFSGDAFSLGLIYEQGTLNQFGLIGTLRTNGIRQFGDDDAKNVYIAGEYRFANNTIRAAYGRMDTGLSVPHSDETIDNYLLGYQYDLSKRTYIWVEYIGNRSDSMLYGDQDAVSIGTRVDF